MAIPCPYKGWDSTTSFAPRTRKTVLTEIFRERVYLPEGMDGVDSGAAK